MRIKALMTLLLAGATVRALGEADVPKGHEHRAQRLIDNGSAVQVDPITNPESDKGKAKGADASAPLVEPALTASEDGDHTAPAGGDSQDGTDTSAAEAGNGEGPAIKPAPTRPAKKTAVKKSKAK